MEQERLSRYLSEAGVASRRHAEDLIIQGRVRVDDHVAVIGEKITPGLNRVWVDGEEVQAGREKVYVLLNKPPGYLSTCYDPFGRPTVVSLVKDVGVRVYPVGRLDQDAQGLLLLTNDGDLTYLLTHPKHHVIKEYMVESHGKPNREQIQKVLSGIMIDGKKVAADYARFLWDGKNSLRIVLGVHEGEKHLIKKMCEAMGYRVESLTRTRIGPITLSGLPTGKWRYLSEKEIEALKTLAQRGGKGELYDRERENNLQDDRKR